MNKYSQFKPFDIDSFFSAIGNNDINKVIKYMEQNPNGTPDGSVQNPFLTGYQYAKSVNNWLAATLLENTRPVKKWRDEQKQLELEKSLVMARLI